MPSFYQTTLAKMERAFMRQVLTNQEIIMSGLQNLQAAVAALQAFAQTVVTELAALETAAAAATGDDDATVDDLASKVTASIGVIKNALPPQTPAASPATTPQTTPAP